MRKNELSMYYRQIAKQLNFTDRESRQWLKQLKANVEEYAAQNSQVTIEDIREHFGTPRELADAYCSSMDSDELNKALNISRFRRRIVYIVLALAIGIALLFFASCVWMIIENRQNQIHIIETEISYIQKS